VEQRQPDTVVLDLGAAGPSFVRDLTAVAPELRVVALAVMETPSNLLDWAKAGIAGLVGEDGTVSDLVETMVSASHDELRCSPWAAGVLLREVRAGAIHKNGDTSLTPREVEIAQLIERGLMNKEIASQLGIELPTVKNHVHRILEKLGAHRRADAAAHIRHAGLSLRD